jgi:catechol 2,3-dioxygenase-like lactoylglutathione lyase family enzyme
MSRVQLALNVADLDASIEFYTKLFQTPPAKIREGYANFAIADPPLKLVLFTGMGEPGSLNHIGVEVESTDQVAAVIARTTELGFDQEIQDNVTCCYALQDKVWVQGPGSESWEVYAVKADAPDEDRAGVLSLVALLFRLAFVAAGPPIGVLVDRVGCHIDRLHRGSANLVGEPDVTVPTRGRYRSDASRTARVTSASEAPARTIRSIRIRSRASSAAPICFCPM